MKIPLLLATLLWGSVSLVPCVNAEELPVDAVEKPEFTGMDESRIDRNGQDEKELEVFLRGCAIREYLFVGSVYIILDREVRIDEKSHPTTKALLENGCTVVIGDSSVGLADLWCDPKDFQRVLNLLRQAKGKDKWLFSVGNEHRYSYEDWLRGRSPKAEAGAGQPATAPESKSEGEEKPQPESKPAPR
jgi:hypothetical protein